MLRALSIMWRAMRDDLFDTEGLQEVALDAGLLIEAKYDPDLHGPDPALDYDMAPGDTIYVDSPLGTAVLRRAAAGRGEGRG